MDQSTGGVGVGVLAHHPIIPGVVPGHVILHGGDDGVCQSGPLDDQLTDGHRKELAYRMIILS